MSTPTIEGMREMSSPPSRSRAVTLSGDDVDVTALFDGDAATQVYVTGAGNLKYKLTGDSDWVTKAVVDNSYHVGRFAQIASSANGTTATGLIADCY